MKNIKLLFVLALLSAIGVAVSCGPSGSLKPSNQAISHQGPPTPTNPTNTTNPTNPTVKTSRAFTKTIGQFSYQRVPDARYYVIRYLQNNLNISRNGFIDLLNQQDVNGRDFRILFNSSIAELPTPSTGQNGYQLQLPVIRASVKGEAVYLLAISDNIAGANNDLYNNYLVHCVVAPTGARMAANYNARFWRIFGVDNTNRLLFSFLDINPALGANLGEGAVVFQGGAPNPDPEQIMVSPCPVTSAPDHNDDLLVHHIYPFTKKASEIAHINRLHALWYAVGQAARQMFDGTNPVKKLTGGAASNDSLFISTHGQGVRYLHVRVEDNPRYYHQKRELISDQPSKNYFLTLFPN